MVSDWFIGAGVVTVIGVVGTLIYRHGAAGNDFLPPWEAYHRALNDAQVARGQFLRSDCVAAARALKDRICCYARKWHIPLCPLCCAGR